MPLEARVRGHQFCARDLRAERRLGRAALSDGRVAHERRTARPRPRRSGQHSTHSSACAATRLTSTSPRIPAHAADVQSLGCQTSRVAEFSDDDFEDARFIGTRLNRARIHDAWMEGVKITGTSLVNAEIWSNNITGMTLNGVEVAPLVEAELDRRHLERRKLFAAEASGVKDAWGDIEAIWDRTLNRALRLAASRLFERTDQLEWSFVETTRHLIYVNEKFLCRVDGKPDHFSRIALPHTSLPSIPPGVEPRVNPSAEDVFTVRQERIEQIRTYMGRLDDDELQRPIGRSHSTGDPRTAETVLRRVHTLLWEEWLHMHFANRDLTKLESA
jgi:DinB superfamily